MSQEIKQEKKKPEKWKKKDWAIYQLNYFPTFEHSKVKLSEKRFIGKDLLKIEDHKFSIGDFSLKYANIGKLNIWKDKNNFEYVAIQDIEGRSYYIHIAWLVKPNKRNIAQNKAFLILKEKFVINEKKRISDTIEYIKTLHNLYKEINLDDLASKTNLDRAQLIEIIESMILNEEFNAEIRGNMLRLKKEAEIVTSPTGYTSETSVIQKTEKKEGMLVFVSYATKDADLFNIAELARKLEVYNEIGEVLYWQEDMHDSIIEYMNDNLGRSDVVLLFCSPNALDSVPVKKEWMAAESLNKPIIPIFFKAEHIPPLLSDRLGIEFDNFNFQGNVQEIYELILKKKQN
ncbi:MAG: toll/interleukin-1 receptor domain-containing protein [Promethearchaeota archaeon]